jgi:hypothetical protein
MKTKSMFAILLGSLFLLTAYVSPAQSETRKVPVFSEISLRVSGTLHLKQGDAQSVEIEASQSTLDELITEVSGRTLVIRFRTSNLFSRNFRPGNIDIYVTVPEVNALGISGSGDIIAKTPVTSRIMDLTVSGSGNINIPELNSEKVKANISGSGDILLGGGKVAQEFEGTISGSGNIKAADYEASTVNIKIMGSGNCSIHTNGDLYARIAGSGNVYYGGNPNLDTSIAGSGKVTNRN